MPAMKAEFDALANELHDHRARDPNLCVVMGIDRNLGELPDPSEAGARARVTEAEPLLRRFEALDRSALSFDDALDADLAQLVLGAEIHDETYTFNGRLARAQTPRAGDTIGDGIFLMLANDPRPAGERLADITSRLERVPDYLDALSARLEMPVERWVKMDLEKVGELPSLFDTVTGLAEEVGFADRARLAAARERAEAALGSYAERLRGLETTTSLHVGDATARRIVELRGIDRPLEELHGWAREFLAETGEAIEALRGELAATYELDPAISVAELHKELNRRFRVRPQGDGDVIEAVLDRYRAERERVLAFIRERDLFPILDSQDMEILRTPGFMAPSIPAGAMVSPPPFREGVRKSLIYLTLSEELLDEHTELGIPSMMVHEGIPGHHLQLATAGTHPSIVRRHVDAMEQAEGWTTMLEDYMLDVGYMGELEREARFSTYRELSRIGARVAIDLFLMTGDKGYLDVGVRCDLSSDDPFEAAGNLLAEVTGFVAGRVQAELNWYSQERGYPLCYLTGNRMVKELKRDMAAAQQGKLEGLDLDRRFHATFLHAGSMPVAYLRRVFAHEGLL
jgi:uncharacterized protein (DUF885 family)